MGHILPVHPTYIVKTSATPLKNCGWLCYQPSVYRVCLFPVQSKRAKCNIRILHALTFCIIHAAILRVGVLACCMGDCYPGGRSMVATLVRLLVHYLHGLDT